MRDLTDGQFVAERYWDLLADSDYIDPFLAFSLAGIKWDNDSVHAFVHYVTADGLEKWYNYEIGTVQIKHDEYNEIDPDHLVRLFRKGQARAKKLQNEAKKPYTGKTGKTGMDS